MRNILLMTFLLIATFLHAEITVYTVKDVPNDHLIDANDYVTNPNEIISPSAELEINQIIASIEDSASAEVAVVLLQSIGDEDIDNFATDLFTTWGIGKKNDNGLLFLLVYDQRQMVFRTGYGLEGALPDIVLGRIIRNDISPSLKQGDFDTGVTNGIRKVYQYLTDPESAKEIWSDDARAKSTVDTLSFGLFFYILVGFSFLGCVGFIIYLVVVLSSKNTNYQKYNRLNGKKFLFIIFTVIFPLFMIPLLIFYFVRKKKLRTQPITCSNCGNMMHRLSESEEDFYLNKTQQLEEQLKSVDYDVWLCDRCKNKTILNYNRLSAYSPCPSCHAKTYYLQNDRIISRATTVSTGKGEKTYACKNCGFINKRAYIIPRVVASSSSSRGGGFGGGGSSGGGSWGGGRTGGGGARGGW